MFENRHLSAYFADPVGLRVGYSNSKKAMLELKRLRIFEVAELRTQKLITKYEAESLETENVSSIKSGFIAEMLKASSISVAFKNKQYKQLTNNAVRYWSYFDYKSLPYFNLDIDVDSLQFYSPPGSLAFYSLSLNSKLVLLNPILFIENLLKHFWQRLNIPYSLNPRDRFNKFLSKVKFDLQYLEQAESQALLMLEDGNFTFNRQGITSSTITNLPIKVLLGEVNDYIVSELDALLYYLLVNQSTRYNLKSFESDPITKLITRLNSLAAPAGTPLILQAFIVESYLKVSKILSRLDESIPKTELLLNSEYTSAKTEIVNTLCLALDALNGLSMFNTVDWAKSQQSKIKDLILYFLSTLPNNTNTDNTVHRLSLFEKPINTATYSDVLSLARDSIVIDLKPPVSNKQGDILSVTAQSYIVWGELQINLKYLNQDRKTKAVNVWILSLTKDVSFNSFRTTLLTNQPRVLNIPIFGLGYGGLIVIASDSDEPPSIEVIDNQTVQSNTLVFENNLND
jgi:hypothetical protein